MGLNFWDRLTGRTPPVVLASSQIQEISEVGTRGKPVPKEVLSSLVPVIETDEVGVRGKPVPPEIMKQLTDAFVVAHLPGQHDQMSHGRGGGGFTTAGVASGLAAFGGGTVQEDPTRALAESSLDAMASIMEEDFWEDEGIRYTRAAVKEHKTFTKDGTNEYGSKLFSAVSEHGTFAGAVHVSDAPDSDAVFVSFLGTTGMTSGAGSALAHQVAKYAASRNSPVLGEPIESAKGFWAKMGWTEDPTEIGTEFFGWTAEQAKEVAAL